MSTTQCKVYSMDKQRLKKLYSKLCRLGDYPRSMYVLQVLRNGEYTYYRDTVMRIYEAICRT